MSRPRRFGKSMFVSMLKELFEGNRKLFEGLAIHDSWDWSKQYPVIRLDFNGSNFSQPGSVEEHAIDLVEEAENEYGMPPTGTGRSASVRLSNLIIKLRKATGQGVVILVDEYDKPILDTLHKTKIAEDNREGLKGLYSVVKRREDEIKFSFFTGVSRFSRASLFSGLNNLKDITLDPNYSAICGYTEADLDRVFASDLDGLDRGKIREWYNGYNWLGDESVYNPYDILYLLEYRKFKYWWYDSGTPEFLVETLKRHDVRSIKLGNMEAEDNLLGSFDVDNIVPVTLLFLAGYLTIADVVESDNPDSYMLGYPNREVRQCLNKLMLSIMLPDSSQSLLQQSNHPHGKLSACDVEGLKSLFQSIFAGIPYQWHTSADITKYESFVASSFYSYFMGTGLDTRAEDFTNRGRIDMTVTGPSYVYLFEFKVVEEEPSGEALKQMKEMDYAQKYRGLGKPVYLAGVEFSKWKRNIVSFKVEPDTGGDSGDTELTASTATADPPH